MTNMWNVLDSCHPSPPTLCNWVRNKSCICCDCFLFSGLSRVRESKSRASAPDQSSQWPTWQRIVMGTTHVSPPTSWGRLMPVCLSFVSCHSTSLWLTGVVKSQMVECCGCQWGCVPSELFSFLLQHYWDRIKAKAKPSAATGCPRITIRSGFLFPSHQCFECWMSNIVAMCVGVCVGVCLLLNSTSACVLDKNTTRKRYLALR